MQKSQGTDAFNQEKALVGAFAVIVQLHRLIVYSTNVAPCSTFATQPPAGPGAAAVAAPTPHLQPLANQRVQEKLLRMI